MSCLALIWDVMLFFGTLVYFHIMIEMVVASGVAVLLWFGLYRAIYAHPWSPLQEPGAGGPFKYVTFKSNLTIFDRGEFCGQFGIELSCTKATASY